LRQDGEAERDGPGSGSAAGTVISAGRDAPLVLEPPEEAKETVEDRERVGRAARDEEVHRDDLARAAELFGPVPVRPPPEIARAPTAMTIFGGGTASHVFFSASSMFFMTGPVIRRPSACRGEATTWMSKRPRSVEGLPSRKEIASAGQASAQARHPTGQVMAPRATLAGRAGGEIVPV